MINPTVKVVESKIKVTIFTNQAGSMNLQYKILDWAAHQGISIFWITCFLNSQENEQGAHVYFDNEIDAIAFKLAWI